MVYESCIVRPKSNILIYTKINSIHLFTSISLYISPMVACQFRGCWACALFSARIPKQAIARQSLIAEMPSSIVFAGGSNQIKWYRVARILHRCDIDSVTTNTFNSRRMHTSWERVWCVMPNRWFVLCHTWESEFRYIELLGKILWNFFDGADFQPLTARRGGNLVVLKYGFSPIF